MSWSLFCSPPWNCLVSPLSTSMRAFHELPEHVLHDIISMAIDATRSKGWQLSLRQVNRTCSRHPCRTPTKTTFPGIDEFNEAVFYVFYLQKRLVAATVGHSLDCITPCHRQFCTSHISFRMKHMYVARFAFTSFLASRDVPGETYHFDQLREQWKAAQRLRFFEESRASSNSIMTSYSSTRPAATIRHLMMLLARFCPRQSALSWGPHISKSRYERG